MNPKQNRGRGKRCEAAIAKELVEPAGVSLAVMM